MSPTSYRLLYPAMLDYKGKDYFPKVQILNEKNASGCL